MEQGGFPLDLKQCEVEIAYLQERIDWVDNIISGVIPPKPKQCGTTVTKVYKINGDYTKQVLDWLQSSSSQDVEVVGSFNRIEYVSINLSSSKQVTEWLLSNGWEPTEWNYKKDKRGKDIKDAFGNRIKTSPKLTKDSLEHMEELGTAGKLILYRSKCTHKRNQIRGFIRDRREDGTVPSVVNTLGAATGRMTHSKIANVPAPKKGVWYKTMRKVFYAPTGYKVVGADADQCQVRALAHYTNDTSLMNAIDDPAIDMHQSNADIAGVTRSAAKNIFYGYLFGAGVAKTAEQMGCSEAEADAARKKFEAKVTSIPKLLKALRKYYRKHGYILGIDGRKIYVESEHMLLVYLLQNFEAVLMKVAMCFAYEAIKRQKLDARFATMQHDEFQMIVKEEHATKVAKILTDSINKAGTFIGSRCIIKGEAKIGNNWYDTH